MTHPRLADLPAPPAGKAGWPWTRTSKPLPPRMPDGSPWPRITVVTPSYNQGEFLEETLRSVLLQGYPNLEYIVMDGGSRDGSVEIIRRYAPWLAHWQSQPDGGQAAAVQAGWERGTGAILAFLNSDDAYLPNAISRAVAALANADPAPAVCGNELRITAEGWLIQEKRWNQPAFPVEHFLKLQAISQPTTFVWREAVVNSGGIDASYHCNFDTDLWMRVAALGAIVHSGETLAAARWYAQTKTAALRPRIADEMSRQIEKAMQLPALQQCALTDEVQTAWHWRTAELYLEHPAHYHKAARHLASLLRGTRQQKKLALWVLRNKAYWYLHRRRLAAARYESVSRLPWAKWVEANCSAHLALPGEG